MSRTRLLTLKSSVCSRTGSESLKWRRTIQSDKLSCSYAGWQRAKREERQMLLLRAWCWLFSVAVSSTLVMPILLSEVRFSLAAGGLQERRISQRFSLSLTVIRNRLLPTLFQQNRSSSALSFPLRLTLISFGLNRRCRCVAHCLGKCV